MKERVITYWRRFGVEYLRTESMRMLVVFGLAVIVKPSGRVKFRYAGMFRA